MVVISPQQSHGLHHCCLSSSPILQAQQPTLSSLSITSSGPNRFLPAAATLSGLHQCPNSSNTSVEIQGKKAQPS